MDCYLSFISAYLYAVYTGDYKYCFTREYGSRCFFVFIGIIEGIHQTIPSDYPKGGKV